MSPERTRVQRTDLPWLRRRQTAQPTQAEQVSSTATPAVADFIHGQGPRPRRHASALVDPVSTGPDRSPLDLSAAPPQAASAPSRPAAARWPERTGSGYQPLRVRAGQTRVLTARSPTVTLTRVQSGIGALTFQAACSDGVGDLCLGCAYQLRSGASSVVQRASGLTVAPQKTRRPLIRADANEFETLTVDLLQNREIQRLIVYAYSASGDELHWGGTLIAHTLGGARIEVPLDAPRGAGVLVTTSLYNVEGEFVLRAESNMIAGSVRDACRSFGFDTITWLDERTPLP